MSAGKAAVLLAGAALCAVGPVVAAESSLTEVWPEIDVFIRINDHWRAVLMTGVTRAADTGVSTETTFGVSFDYFHTALRPAWVKVFPGIEQYWGVSTRIGYNRVAATNPSGPAEDRGVLEATLRSKPLWADIVLANRVRTDLRIIGGEFSWRGRNRTRIERTWALPLLTLPVTTHLPQDWRAWRSATPYVMAEFFWDSRYSSWTREYYQVGVEYETQRGHSIDLFIARQYDDRSQGARITVAGVALSLRY